MTKYYIYTTTNKDNIDKYYAGYNGTLSLKKQVVKMDLGGYSEDDYIGEKMGNEYIVKIEKA